MSDPLPYDYLRRGWGRGIFIWVISLYTFFTIIPQPRKSSPRSPVTVQCSSDDFMFYTPNNLLNSILIGLAKKVGALECKDR